MDHIAGAEQRRTAFFAKLIEEDALADAVAIVKSTQEYHVLVNALSEQDKAKIATVPAKALDAKQKQLLISLWLPALAGGIAPNDIQICADAVGEGACFKEVLHMGSPIEERKKWIADLKTAKEKNEAIWDELLKSEEG